MKLGLSSYSLYAAMKEREMTIMDVIDWTANNGGQHIEMVPELGFSLKNNPEFADEIRTKAHDAGIEISNYAIGANFIQGSKEAYSNEIERVKKEVDMADRLGVKLMRHDVATRSDTSIRQFEEDVPELAAACREIADYASRYDMTTSVENHGFYIQASDRIQSLIHHVGRDNFKTTLDVANFLCVDEDPVSAVKKNIPFASMAHIKDFYYRDAYPGEGWIQTEAGNYLRGAIAGHGDISISEILKVIKESGYDGYISVEFEGMEDCKKGSRISIDNVFRIWNEI